MRRLFLACFLAACSGPTDDVVTRPDTPDATTFDAGTTFTDASAPKEAEAGPVFNGGPLACGACTCDGTLYACFEGNCRSPPVIDAGPDDDADADAGSASCLKNAFCSELPVECLPKPTCDCIEKATGLVCIITPDGHGFGLSCP